jgi:hypothetical protein
LYAGLGRGDEEERTRCLAEVNYILVVRASRSYNVCLMAEQALGIVEFSFIEKVADINHGGGNCSYLYDENHYTSNF